MRRTRADPFDPSAASAWLRGDDFETGRRYCVSISVLGLHDKRGATETRPELSAR
ncbi:hypothetical protein [uncultured Tessaracoccus sp.]|uniref:hypothetical protein n=1 Tax=uncultured Tessaracoccus sp. TaxID=905023 RepID=UPI0026087E30|nr:hypothetical protein [uncultured Tessaracoccus sp.]